VIPATEIQPKSFVFFWRMKQTPKVQTMMALPRCNWLSNMAISPSSSYCRSMAERQVIFAAAVMADEDVAEQIREATLMPEQITINIVRPEVGVQYIPATREAELGDELAAVELGLRALARHAITLRERLSRQVPQVPIEVVQAIPGVRCSDGAHIGYV
jgi:hypothetical protein